MERLQNAQAMEVFEVVHPLRDKPEKKLQTTRLGPIEMTTGLKICLMVLRVYLTLMTFMLVYHVAGLAGIFGRR
jgi:hypothetical protein